MMSDSCTADRWGTMREDGSCQRLDGLRNRQQQWVIMHRTYIFKDFHDRLLTRISDIGYNYTCNMMP